MQSVYVVSDLHMFCRRSQWERHLKDIEKAAAEADLFVFNGDTVDFKWSCYPSLEQTVAKSIEFFEDFARQHPNCWVHVNLGNHDHDELFIHELDKLAKRVMNFTWHPYFLRVNNTIFLHGDAANRKMRHVDLERYRASWLMHKRQGKMKNRVYDMAFSAGAHVAVSRLAFPHKRTLRRLSAYLRDIGHGTEEGVERVYFGHTHVPVPGHEYGGVEYHNGGAPMEGMGFKLLKAVV